ncbi:MAG TPA: hypothetical protein PKU93_00950 [Candidatus Pacearchaeota archaeon]|nr:hypothetical protein [Candidatus Pacearchaeota archaeon]
MTNLDKQILDQIKDLKPIAKWKFLFKNYLIWSLGILFLIFSSFACALLLYLVINNDWEHSKLIAGSFWDYWIASFPHIWFVFTVVFLIISYQNFKHTEKGYRIRHRKLITINILTILFLAFVFCSFGLGNAIDAIDLEQSKIFNQRKVLWINPDKGFLAGEVIEKNEDSLKLIDFEGKLWTIDVIEANITPYTEEGVKILGNQVSEDTFKAKEVLPWSRIFLFEKDFLKELP